MSEIVLVQDHQLIVDPKISFKEFIERCNLNSVHRCCNPTNFSPPDRGSICTYYLAQTSELLNSQQIKDLLAKEGYRGAHLWALLELAFRYPEIPPESFPIGALGSIWLDSDNNNLPMVPFLIRKDFKRQLTLFQFNPDTEFTPQYRFLVQLR